MIEENEISEVGNRREQNFRGTKVYSLSSSLAYRSNVIHLASRLT
jgi:hypothetical protein